MHVRATLENMGMRTEYFYCFLYDPDNPSRTVTLWTDGETLTAEDIKMSLEYADIDWNEFLTALGSVQKDS